MPANRTTAPIVFFWCKVDSLFMHLCNRLRFLYLLTHGLLRLEFFFGIMSKTCNICSRCKQKQTIKGKTETIVQV